MKTINLRLQTDLVLFSQHLARQERDPRLGSADYGGPVLISKCISPSSEKFVEISGFSHLSPYTKVLISFNKQTSKQTLN